MRYDHTQTGYLILVIIVLIAGLFGFILWQAEFELPVALIMLFILFILASFSTLNVTIDEENLNIKFGYGIVKKSFILSEISSVKVVRNHWYYGWGIRFWFWPPMVIFNISGFDAVELKMKNNKIYRIGTDEPEILQNALIQSIH
jgi:hypothetical protein